VSPSCANLFSDLSVKDSDNAKLFQAKLELDRSQWTEAITTIGTLSPTLQATADVQTLLASAYAGRCGIDMLNLINGVSQSTGGLLFETLLETMTNATLANIDDCILAETTLNAIGAPAARTVDQNLLMTFVELGKMGAILNFRADLSGDNKYDRVNDITWNACNNADLPQHDAVGDAASADQFVYSVSVMYQSLLASGSTIAQADLANITTICTAGAFCNVASPAAVTGPQRTAIRGMISEDQSVGLGTVWGHGKDSVAAACGN